MKEILLSQDRVALVDDSDYQWLNQWKWTLSRCRRTIYAHRYPTKDARRTMILMHRLIMGILQNPELHVDHINHDGLDNRRVNLRLATQQQNLQNSRKYRNTRFRFKGVRKRPKHNWEAYIKVDRKFVTIGSFLTEEEAAKAYDAAARQHFGEFACCNFPVESP